MTTHPGGIARLLYYPASSKNLKPLLHDNNNDDPSLLQHKATDEEIGLGAHSDYECFTILLCSTASGLEILSPRDNIWVPAPVVQGSFIVNVGDFLMRWTNGKSFTEFIIHKPQPPSLLIPQSVMYHLNRDSLRHRRHLILTHLLTYSFLFHHHRPLQIHHPPRRQPHF